MINLKTTSLIFTFVCLRRKKEENDARYERSRSNATPSPPNSNFSSKKDNSSSWEFDWSRQKSKNSSTSASDSSSSPQPNSEEDEAKEHNDSFGTNYSPTGNKNFDDIYNVNSIYNTKYFECHYCYKRLTDKEDLLSHQSICKRLSSNRIKNKYYSSKPADFYPAKEFSSASATAPSSTANTHSQPMTECVKCRVSMNTYDYLLHHCNDSTKSKSDSGPESRANLHSASSNLSSSSFKYAYRHKPSLESTCGIQPFN